MRAQIDRQIVPVCPNEWKHNPLETFALCVAKKLCGKARLERSTPFVQPQALRGRWDKMENPWSKTRLLAPVLAGSPRHATCLPALSLARLSCQIHKGICQMSECGSSLINNKALELVSERVRAADRSGSPRKYKK
ncbi:hypothetical protein PoB_001068300 [Plakobranchus ocellatus]|uniref:Uncharacterized protein n=1 Tax=Plakobranchus ocellatus TaxID=259542 RepID=A0AAV3YPA6_9GAST|nr:hypothetical protein PoB_001068300 [Plakobranchus ocellatus]